MAETRGAKAKNLAVCVCVLCYYERHNERLAGESNVFLCVCDMVRVEKKVSFCRLLCQSPAWPVISRGLIFLLSLTPTLPLSFPFSLVVFIFSCASYQDRSPVTTTSPNDGPCFRA